MEKTSDGLLRRHRNVLCVDKIWSHKYCMAVAADV